MIVDAFFTYLIEKFYNKNAVRVVVLLFNSFINDTNVIWKVVRYSMGSFSPRRCLVLLELASFYSNPMSCWQPWVSCSHFCTLGILLSMRAVDFWTSLVSTAFSL